MARLQWWQSTPRCPALLLVLLAFAVASGAASPDSLLLPERACNAEAASAGLPFCDPALPLDDRIEDLIARLTVEEKVGACGCILICLGSSLPVARHPRTRGPFAR